LLCRCISRLASRKPPATTVLGDAADAVAGVMPSRTACFSHAHVSLYYSTIPLPHFTLHFTACRTHHISRSGVELTRLRPVRPAEASPGTVFCVRRHRGAAPGGPHVGVRVRHRRHPRRVGDAVRAVPQEATAASTRRAPSPAAARPVGLVQAPPAARVRGAGRAVRQRGQCLMVASTPAGPALFPHTVTAAASNTLILQGHSDASSTFYLVTFTRLTQVGLPCCLLHINVVRMRPRRTRGRATKKIMFLHMQYGRPSTASSR
jgi:hypothetical protein